MSTDTPTPRTDAASINGYMTIPENGVTRTFARTLERELAEMTARAEAAEAACFEKDKALSELGNHCEELTALGYVHRETQQPISWSPDGVLSQAKAAIALSPSETRSVIAGLREEVVMSEINGKVTLEELEALEVKYCQLEAHRDALISLMAEILTVLEERSVGHVVTYSERLLPFIPKLKAAVSGAQAGAKGESKP